ncbi:MAG: SRPBCC family protein [Ilumatobacter fluminis]|uniref:SRPBCC family protein n=1 Tax=Ilumatobacter fluminis TaxID=467091 RepID=UPI0032EDF868
MAQLTERPADWASTAPIVVENTRRIAAPVETVWERIADHETWPEWFTDLSSVTVTFGAEGVGGGRDVKVPGMTVKERFTAWEPPHHFAFTLFEGPRIMTSMAESVALVPDSDGDGCTITYTQGIEPAKGFGWLVKLAAKRLDVQQRAALDKLAALVE